MTTVKGLTFAQFMERVNSKLISLTKGLSSEDMADYCYIDCWRNGDNPVETAKDALEYARDSY